MQRRRRLVPSLLAAVFVVGLLVPVGQANPNVPYCEGSVVGTNAQRVIMPEICEATTGRVFPEAYMAKDFVSFFEFEAGLQYLDANYPDLIEVIEVGRSAGLSDATGTVHDFPVYIVEVSNEKSPMPAEAKQQLFFMLSIHGNEKGGREGGFRVIEDFVKGIDSAAATVQNGAGMPTPFAKPTGGNVETYADYLDFMRLVFIFPNPDGWAHDELEFVTQPCVNYLPTLFCRVNGNGIDLNRQSPTLGWHNSGREVVGEPESRAYFPYIKENYDVDYAIDIHGMLNHENFAAIMMPAGSFSPQEMLRSTRIAVDLKDRLNADDHFNGWTSTWQAQQTAAQFANGATCEMVDVCLPEGTGLGSGEFADWSTVWDAIGYTDSGFHGDWFAQQTGFNAPGYDIELAYNHITVDSQYEGAGAFFNDYHVQMVRTITQVFMDAAALDVKVSYDSGGSRTLYVESPYVATNGDDENQGPGGWAEQNPDDDLWDYGPDQVFKARPAKYFADMVPVLRDGEAPGVLTATSGDKLTRGLLDRYDTLVIAGSAINPFFVDGTANSNMLPESQVDEAKVALVLDWVERGGNLVLTDAALNFLDMAGITDDAVGVHLQYAGAINLDRQHELNTDVRGVARQTFEPVPVGFSVGYNSPNWYVDSAAFDAVGGDSAGWTVNAGCAERDSSGDCIRQNNPHGVSLGRLNVGDGRIQFIGALLPDPTEEFYHPYGLDDYATTYSGNQILRNMMGWQAQFAAPPVVIEADGTIVESANEPEVPGSTTGGGSGNLNDDDGKGAPGFQAVALLALLGAIAVVARRRR